MSVVEVRSAPMRFRMPDVVDTVEGAVGVVTLHGAEQDLSHQVPSPHFPGPWAALTSGHSHLGWSHRPQRISSAWHLGQSSGLSLMISPLARLTAGGTVGQTGLAVPGAAGAVLYANRVTTCGLVLISSHGSVLFQLGEYLAYHSRVLWVEEQSTDPYIGRNSERVQPAPTDDHGLCLQYRQQ